ncbi:MAG: macro domain-containing protein [Sutterellaceae bacterium]|nr:macro domain-containing protein [Sutterellaceae bacterium]
MIPITDDVASRIQVIKADITTLAVDAVVSSANADLTGGGAVDQAIHHVAGPGLRKACHQYVEQQGRCFAGGASITEGFKLPARYVIHAVGPVWCGGEDGEAALLARCYARSFELARLRNLQTIAFSSISTGQYRFPKDVAALVALHVAVQVLEMDSNFKTVVFCVFDDENKEIYENLIKEGRALAKEEAAA